MNIELENRLDKLRRRAEILFREQRRQRAIAAQLLANLKCVIGEIVEAHCAAASQKMEMKAWLEDWKTKPSNKF